MADPSAREHKLLPDEEWWRDHRDWLENKGYRLRPRYQPNWPSLWEGRKAGTYTGEYEDAWPSDVSNTVRTVTTSSLNPVRELLSLMQRASETEN